MEKTIFTLGTSTRSLEDFIGILRSRGISRVCDVRSFPASRRFPHFAREPLSAALEEAGIAYVWMGESLGGYREGGYEAHMRGPVFLAGLEELERMAAEEPTALVCAEMLPWKCHRLHIATALRGRAWRVVHIIDAERDWDPSPTPLPLFEEGDEG